MNIKRIDPWLIDKVFQPVSDRFEKETRENNFYLSYFFCALGLGLAIVGDTATTNFELGTACFIIFIAFIIYIHGIKMNYRRKSEQNPGIANPEKTNAYQIVMRQCSLFICIVLGVIFPATTVEYDKGTLFYGFSVFSATASLYFAACTPLPD